MAKSKKSAFSRFSKQQLIIGGVFILGFGGFGVYKLAFSSALIPDAPDTTSTTFPASKMTYAGGGTGGTSALIKDGIDTVIALRTKSSPYAIAITSGNYTGNMDLPSGTDTVRACANIKRMGTADFSITSNSSGSNYPYPNGLAKNFSNMTTSSDYYKLCTDYIKTNGKSNKFYIYVQHNIGAEIRVKSVTLDWTTAGGGSSSKLPGASEIQAPQ